MIELNKKCFVCNNNVPTDNLELNADVNLFVCNNCKGTYEEKKAVAELLDSLADGLVCGCI
jgi:predicted metal-binding protein